MSCSRCSSSRPLVITLVWFGARAARPRLSAAADANAASESRRPRPPTGPGARDSRLDEVKPVFELEHRSCTIRKAALGPPTFRHRGGPAWRRAVLRFHPDILRPLAQAMSALLAQNWWAVALRGVFADHVRTDRVLRARARRSCRSSCSSPPTCWSTASSASSRPCVRRVDTSAGGCSCWRASSISRVGVIAFIWPGLTVLVFVLMMAAWSLDHRRADDRRSLQAQPDLRARLADLQRHRLGAVRHRARRSRR